MKRRGRRRRRWMVVAVVMLLAGAGVSANMLGASSEPVARKKAAPVARETTSPTPSPVVTLSKRAAPRKRVVEAQQPTCGTKGAVYTYRVSVQGSLRDEFSPKDFERDVRRILCSESGWSASGAVRFRYDPDGEFLIGLWTADGAERRCMELISLSVSRQYSCADRGKREAVINADRWRDAVEHWSHDGGVASYREMVINHEVGHTLGLHHQPCAADGKLAPVMMQQSKFLTQDGRTCAANPRPTNAELSLLRAVRG